MKVSFYFLSLILICLLSSCNNLQKTNPNNISVEILGLEQPDSIKLVSFNNSEGVVAKNGNPYLFNFGNTINDAFVMDVFKNGKTHSKKIFLDGEIHGNKKGYSSPYGIMTSCIIYDMGTYIGSCMP